VINRGPVSRENDDELVVMEVEGRAWKEEMCLFLSLRGAEKPCFCYVTTSN